MFQQGWIWNHRDIKPVAVLGKELCERFELEVRLLDLCVVKGIAHSMLNSAEVAVERLATDGFAYLIKQFTKVLTRSKASVPARVYVSEIENWDGSFDVICDLKHLLKAAPQFLPATGFNTD